MVTSGTFPKRFITGPTAVVQILPWLVAYNTNNVKGADIPKDWTDLLKPKWKTQILLSNPKVSDAYIHFWSLLHDKYGDAFFEKLRPNLRPAATGVQAAQGLGAGEASFLIPAVSPQVMEPMKKGAPVNMVILPYTTGVEQHIVLTARGKTKHPNAARLFADYIMTEEGNKLMNSDPGGFSMYETAKLPKEYHSPRPGATTRRESTAKLLGF